MENFEKEIESFPIENNEIKVFRATPIAGNRIKVMIDLFENHTKPNLTLSLKDADGVEITRSFILGTIDQHVEFTLHVRVAEPILPLTLTCESYLDENAAICSKSIEITTLA